MPQNGKNILLFGGRENSPHNYSAICPILENHIREIRNFKVDYIAQNCDAFLPQRLAPYDALVLYHTGGELTPQQKSGLLEWVASGKGFVGIHGATCSFDNSPEYFAMLGGRFKAHPFVREYTVSLVDSSFGITSNHSHPVLEGIRGHAVKDWGKWPVYEYGVTDEQYLIDYDPRVQVLAAALFKGVSWPVAWVKPWGKGRVFYLALGHDVEACKNPFFKQIIKGGIKWAAGEFFGK